MHTGLRLRARIPRWDLPVCVVAHGNGFDKLRRKRRRPHWRGSESLRWSCPAASLSTGTTDEYPRSSTVHHFAVAKVVRAVLHDPKAVLENTRQMREGDGGEVSVGRQVIIVSSASLSTPEGLVSFLDSATTKDGENKIFLIREEDFTHLLSKEVLSIGGGTGGKERETPLQLLEGEGTGAKTFSDALSKRDSDLMLSSASKITLLELQRSLAPSSATLLPPSSLPGVNTDGTVTDVPSSLLTEREKQFLDAARRGDREKLQSLQGESEKYGVGERGAILNVNVHEPTHGGTALHIVAGNLSLSAELRLLLVEWLCSCGAEVNSRATNGSTPLHWAAGAGAKETVLFLLERGADIDARTYTWTRQVFGRGSGQTALHWAAEGGHREVVQLLLSASDLAAGALDERGQTAKDMARRELHFDLEADLQKAEEKKYVALTFTTELAAHKLLRRK